MRRPAAGAALCLAVILPIACGADGTTAPERPPTSTTTATTAPAPVAVDWEAPGLDVAIGAGLRARHCEGDAPLLCIERAGIPVGVVELIDLPAGEARPLEDRIADLYRSTAADRAQGCPAGYRFETEAPRRATVGGGEGLRYGFTGTFADGRPSERTIAWMVERGEVITVVVAAADEADGCLPPEGAGHFTTATLDAAAGALERLVAGSRLPPP